MKITVQTDDLKKALTATQRAAGSLSSAITSLAYTRLIAEEGSLALSATDLVVGLTQRIDAEIERAGEACFDGRLLLEWVQSVSDPAVSLETNAKTMQTIVRAGHASTTLKGVALEDFPSQPEFIEREELFALEGTQLHRMIAQTAFAAARDESRPVLAGVYLEISPGSLEMSSADGFRMSYIETANAPRVKDTVTAIVSRKALMVLASLELAETAKVRFCAAPGGGALVASFGPYEWVGRLIDGTFPNVAQLVPKDLTDRHRVTLSRDALTKALKGLRMIAKQNNDVVFLTPKADHLHLEARSEIGEADAEVGAEVTSPPDTTPERMAMNIFYLLEALPSLRTDTIELAIAGPNQPVVLRSPKDDAYRHVAMPMIVGEERR